MTIYQSRHSTRLHPQEQVDTVNEIERIGNSMQTSIKSKLYLFPNLLLVPPGISDVRGHEERGHGAHGPDHPGRDEHARVADSVVQDVHLAVDSVDMVDNIYSYPPGSR